MVTTPTESPRNQKTPGGRWKRIYIVLRYLIYSAVVFVGFLLFSLYEPGQGVYQHLLQRAVLVLYVLASSKLLHVLFAMNWINFLLFSVIFSACSPIAQTTLFVEHQDAYRAAFFLYPCIVLVPFPLVYVWD